MKLICITGIDGAGKTTLARNLVEALRQEGTPAFYIYGRTYPLISRLVMFLGRLALLSKHDQWKNYAGYEAAKISAMQNPFLKFIYTLTIYLDYFPQIWLKLSQHMFKDGYVVLDRYIYDTVISDLTVHLNYTAEQTKNAIDGGLRFLPIPLATILIDLPEEIAFSRKDDVPHIDYLRERRKWYLGLTTRPEVEVLEGEASPEQLVQSIRMKILSQKNGVLV